MSKGFFLNSIFLFSSKTYLNPTFTLKLSWIAVALLSFLLFEVLKYKEIITVIFSNILYILLMFQVYLDLGEKLPCEWVEQVTTFADDFVKIFLFLHLLPTF